MPIGSFFSEHFKDALKKACKKIEKSNDLFLKNPALLLYNRGELLIAFITDHTFSKKETFGLLPPLLEEKAHRYPGNIVGEFFLPYIGAEQMLSLLRMYPALYSPYVFSRYKTLIEDRMRADIEYANQIFFYLRTLECFSILREHPKFHSYFKNFDRIFPAFQRTCSEEFLAIFPREHLLHHIETSPLDTALSYFRNTLSKALFSLFDRGRLIEYFISDPSAFFDLAGTTNYPGLYDLPIKEATRLYSKNNPDKAVRALLLTNSETLFTFMDASMIRKQLQSRDQACFLVGSRCSGMNPSDYASYISEKKKFFVLLTEHNVRTWFVRCIKKYPMYLTEEDLNPIREDLSALFACYAKLLERSHDSPRMRTVGIELEFFNSQEQELRPPILAVQDILVLLSFLRSISVLVYKKFDSLQKENLEEFPGFPHSNLHINISVTEQELQYARKNFWVLDALTYLYSLAYSPLPRICYLEYGLGKSRFNSLDFDLQRIQPHMFARYQTRYFSIGGTREEIKSSLSGIGTIARLLPLCFDKPDQLPRTEEILYTDTKIQNICFELGWHVEEFKKIPKKYRVPQNKRLRQSYIETQERLRTALSETIEPLFCQETE